MTMRSSILLGSSFSLLALLAPAGAAEPDGHRIEDLGFLAGSWANEADGRRSEEHWTAPAGGLMLGLHRDVASGRAAFEFLRIEASAEGITYLASPAGRPATPFRLVELAPSRAVFANPEHDFPQRIHYWRAGEELCAAVEGLMDGEAVRQEWCWKPSSLSGR